MQIMEGAAAWGDHELRRRVVRYRQTDDLQEAFESGSIPKMAPGP